MTGEDESTVRVGQSGVELLLRRVCALVVAGVAAYASYRHQRVFALEGGADVVSAALWPLSVDRLLVLASAGLLKSQRDGGGRARVIAWSSFVFGVVVSSAANVASAPSLGWQPVLVAGWPPVALLLAVELLAHRPRPRHWFEPDEAGTKSVAASQLSDPQQPCVRMRIDAVSAVKCAGKLKRRSACDVSAFCAFARSICGTCGLRTCSTGW
jgi:hypothetical protein